MLTYLCDKVKCKLKNLSALRSRLSVQMQTLAQILCGLPLIIQLQFPDVKKKKTKIQNKNKIGSTYLRGSLLNE